MRSVCIFAIVALITPFPVRGDEPSFTALFNGKDLTGWHVGKENLNGKTASADGRFVVKDGAIKITGAPKIEDIYTTASFDHDFTLTLEFRASANANSGLYIRGKQLQVRDYKRVGPYKDLKTYKDGDWNTIEVVVKGEKARCTCNGELLEEALIVPAKGSIGLQSETNVIEYRALRLKESR